MLIKPAIIGLAGVFMLLTISSAGRSWTIETRDQAANGPDLGRVREQMIAATNQFRVEEKQAKLKVNEALSKAAQSFAEFMAESDKYGHDADGKQPADRVKAAGYEFCLVAENIAYEVSPNGLSDKELARAFMDGWKNSPPHWRNLLDPDMREFGVGVAQSSKSGKFYAVQNFGRPKSEEIEFELNNRSDIAVKYTLDGQDFSIEPRYTMKHRMCRPSDLKIELPSSKPGASKEGEVMHPAADAHFVIRKDGSGKYLVETK
jgi:uncharacterized protein YkwD